MNNDFVKEARIANLNRVQEERKQQTLTKVEQTLDRMVSCGMKINFSTLATEANVSQSYLYKYPEIKAKIAEIRNQQSSMPRPRSPEPASAKSNQVIVSRLKDRIRNLEAEVRGLRNTNEGLAGRVYRVSELEAMVERQQKHVLDLEERLKACEFRQESASKKPADDPKVTPIQKGERRKSDIPESVKAELETLGIPLNTNLIKKIKSVSELKVRSAIEALKQAMEEGEVRSPGGWIASAIEDGWAKNEPRPQKTLTYKPRVYTAPEDTETELIDPEKMKELWKRLK